MEILILILVPGCFFAGLFVGKTMRLKKQELKKNKIAIADELCQAILYKGILTEIRENRMTNGIANLEFALDCSVSMLWHMREKSDGILKEHADQVLKAIKLYREKWPRQIDTHAEEDDEFDAAARAQIEATTSESRDILNKLPN